MGVSKFSMACSELPLTLSFHQHLCGGVLHRISFVPKMLDLLLARGDTVFMTGAEICDRYLAADPESGA